MNYLDSDTAVSHAEHHTSNTEFKRNVSHHREWKRNRKYDDLSVVQWFCSLKTGCWILMTNVIVLGFDFGKWLDMSGIYPPKQKEAPKASILDSFHYGKMIQCEELPTTNRKASHHQTLHRPWYSVLRGLTHWTDQVKLALLAGQEQTQGLYIFKKQSTDHTDLYQWPWRAPKC